MSELVWFLLAAAVMGIAIEIVGYVKDWFEVTLLGALMAMVFAGAAAGVVLAGLTA